MPADVAAAVDAASQLRASACARAQRVREMARGVMRAASFYMRRGARRRRYEAR